MTLDVERAVRERYAAAAAAAEPALCCPIDYDPRHLRAIPAEILERDYGCGDPSRHLRPGEVVLDLGSGGGKAAYIASQVVGPEGRVIGVDVNEAMLDLARRHRDEVARAIGWSNVEFRKGRIQDLALDLEALEARLREHPVGTAGALLELEEWMAVQRRERPLVADGSIDVVVSNCVLNLVRPEDKRQLFQEMYRVLRRGGRAVISDIVSDEDVPLAMQNDPDLWSGCISGAFREDAFLHAFEDAGFHGLRILERPSKPWRTVQGIEFRSLTVEAFTGKRGPCLDHNQAVVYLGPWKSVADDDGHVLERGARTAVCAKTYGIYTSEPYRASIAAVDPLVPVDPAAAPPFACDRNSRRDPRETKGAGYAATDAAACAPGGACC